MIVEHLGLPAIAEAGKAALLGLVRPTWRGVGDEEAAARAEDLAAWREIDIVSAEADIASARSAQLHHQAAAALEEIAGELRGIAGLIEPLNAS